MKRRYELTEDADGDINALWLYIAQNRSLDTADRLADRIYDAFELLAENPFMGHQREELTDRPVRFWNVGRYTIVYRPLPPASSDHHGPSRRSRPRPHSRHS